MVPPIDEDRSVADGSAAPRARKVRCRRNLGHTRTCPVIVSLGAVGTKARVVRADAIAITILALAELDVIDPDAPDEVEFVTRTEI